MNPFLVLVLAGLLAIAAVSFDAWCANRSIERERDRG